MTFEEKFELAQVAGDCGYEAFNCSSRTNGCTFRVRKAVSLLGLQRFACVAYGTAAAGEIF
jgi:hypothetical protein